MRAVGIALLLSGCSTTSMMVPIHLSQVEAVRIQVPNALLEDEPPPDTGVFFRRSFTVADRGEERFERTYGPGSVVWCRITGRTVDVQVGGAPERWLADLPERPECVLAGHTFFLQLERIDDWAGRTVIPDSGPSWEAAGIILAR